MTRLMGWTAGAALALALTACGDDTAAPAADDGKATTAEKLDALLPGEYEITATVTALSVTEGESAATPLTLDAARTHRVCVGEDGVLPPETFGEENDNCTIDSQPYFRKGKVREAMTCSRDGKTGQVNVQVNAEFDAEGLEGEVRSATFFTGPGDYQMTRSLSGKRVGDCTAGEVAADMEGVKTAE